MTAHPTRTTLGDIVASAEPGFACGADVSKGLLQLRMNNVTSDGIIDWTDRRRVPVDAGNIERYGLKPGDIMFNCTNSSDLVGKTALFSGFSEPVAYSNHFLRVRLNRKWAEPGYVTWWLFRQWRQREFERLAKCWVNQATVRKDDLLDMQIDLPDLPTQRRIAGILDKADRLRRMRRYALELSDQFLPSLFLRMFGDPVTNPKKYPVVPAGRLFHIQLGKMLDEKRYTGLCLRSYLGNANVQWGYFDLADVKQMDFPPEDFEQFRLQVGDILVCEGGEVGRTAIWRGEIPDCCYQKAVHRLRHKTERIRPDYFQWYMRAAATSGLVARETSTSTIGHFTAERFEVFPVVVPPIAAQDHFVSAVAAHREHQSTLREALRQAEHLFQSLLDSYFDGRSRHAN